MRTTETEMAKEEKQRERGGKKGETQVALSVFSAS
jgi:hypothetical protein